MKKVLLLGDSIRLNYMPMVFRQLDGIAEVVGPEDNCRFAKYTLFYANTWIEELGKPDIIHWNNGLWDVSHNKRPSNSPLSTPDEYVRDLSCILNEFRKTGAKIIFATSTPILEGNITFNNSDIIKYNNLAVDLMKNEGIEINDLYSFVLPRVNEFIDINDKTHLNKIGIKEVGKEVAGFIKQFI